ncbi:MAG: hypothetical protein ACRD3S_19455, partial [Terracidiphilus sp.]
VDPSQPRTPVQPHTPPAATSPDPSAPPYAPAVASYPPAAYPPPKKGMSALKIVLIIVGIIVGLGIIAVVVVGYVGYRMVKNSQMTTSSQPVTAADLDVPLYPGAVQGQSVHMTLAGKDMLTATFVTSDPKEQVVEFYKSNLGPGAIDATSFNSESLRLKKSADETVAVTVAYQPGGKTQIVIVHITKDAASSN